MEENEFESMLGLNGTVQELNKKAMLKRKREGIGCVLCDYTGFTISKDQKQVMCSCTKDKFYYEVFKKANVPNLYIGKNIEDWNTRTDAFGNDLGVQQNISEKTYALVKFYIKHLNGICTNNCPTIKHSGNMKAELHSLLFEGGIGSGKTFLASIMVQHAIRKNLSAKYYDWNELIETLIDFNKKDLADDVVEEFKNLDFIVLDGVEYSNFNHPQLPHHLDRVSKARANSGKPIMIFASNDHPSIQAGSGWKSLLKNCLLIRLPRAIN